MTAVLDLLPGLLQGTWVTLQVFAGASLLSILLGFLAGLARLSGSAWLGWLALVYIESFRGTSALVQLFWFYFVLPQFGFLLPPLAVGIVVLGMNYGAYAAEVVRGAVQSVPSGQTEAAIALNFSPFQRMVYIILPQAIVRVLPPLGNQQIELLKNSALVSFIGVQDLTFEGRILLQPYPQRAAEIFGITLLLYFGLALVLTALFRSLENFLGRGMRGGGS